MVIVGSEIAARQGQASAAGRGLKLEALVHPVFVEPAHSAGPGWAAPGLAESDPRAPA